jgi:hypothetical protein
MTVNKKEIGKTFKQDAQPINVVLEELTEEQKEKLMNDMKSNNEIIIRTAAGKEIKLGPEFV